MESEKHIIFEKIETAEGIVEQAYNICEKTVANEIFKIIQDALDRIFKLMGEQRLKIELRIRGNCHEKKLAFRTLPSFQESDCSVIYEENRSAFAMLFNTIEATQRVLISYMH